MRPSLRRLRPSWALAWLSAVLPCSFISSFTKPAGSFTCPLTLMVCLLGWLGSDRQPLAPTEVPLFHLETRGAVKRLSCGLFPRNPYVRTRTLLALPRTDGGRRGQDDCGTSRHTFGNQQDHLQR